METLQRTANRGSISTGFDIDNSLKFEADNTEIIYRNNDVGTNRKTFTVSAWFKRTELGVDQEVWHGGRNGQTTVMGILSYSSADDNLWVDVGGGTGNTGTLYRSFSTQKIRDTSAWYHFVLAVDTTQATEANRMKVWLNGEEVTDWAQHQIPVQDFQCALESGTDMAWGGFRPSNVTLFSGYLAECHYLDGVAKVQTDFGEYDEDSGIWIPKKYTGAYGGNGCYMKFDDSSALGTDSSGNSNDFTLNNITSADQATDTPTNNFATLNPLHYTTRYTITEGGTNQVSSANGWGASVGSIGVTSGKWYFEVQSSDTNGYTLLGVIDQDSVIGTYVNADAHAGDAPYGITYYGGGGSIITNGSAVSGLAFPTWTTETMGCALDLDNNKIYFSKSGTYGNSGDPAAGSNGLSLPTGGSGTWFISTSTYFAATPAKTNQGGYTANSISSAASDENGYGTFEYAPPSGYYALCTKNLAEYG